MTGRKMRSLQVRAGATALLVLTALSCSDSTGPSAGPPATVQLVAGGGQSAIVATQLPARVRVQVLDAQSRPVRSTAVTWAVQAGGGSVVASAAQTDRTGVAEATWTLGTVAGVQRVTAQVASLPPLEVTATASSAAASDLVVHAGGAQSAVVGAAVAVAPAVRVRDGYSNPVPGVTVTCEVTVGGGSLTDGTAVSDAAGVAAVGSWVLGTTPGTNGLTCSATGLGTVSFAAVAAAGPPSALTIEAGDNQTTFAGSAVATPPAVRVRDAHDNPVAGAQVVFAVATGGGAVTGGTTTTNASGIATVGGWTLGLSAGSNTLTATVAGLQVTFTAQGEVAPEFLLSIEDIHLNQGSQSAAGTIGGVAGRPGLLRVVVRANAPNNHSPGVRVRLYNGATQLREATIAAPQPGVPVQPDLNSASQTWNLALAANEVVAGLSVEAVVDPDNTIPGGQPELRRFPRDSGTKSLDVQPLAPLRIAFIPIHATVQDRTGAITTANVNTYLEAVRQWIPGNTIAPTVRTPYSTDLDLSVGANWSTLLSEIQAVRTLESATDAYYHGIIGDFPGIPYGGLAYRPTQPSSTFRSGLSYDRPSSTAGTIAHELGHNMGRMHNACGNPANIDPAYPYENSIIGAPGWDILSGVMRDATQFRDYMSYCSPRYTSDYTYGGILQWRRADPYAQASSAQAAMAAAPQSGLLLWGSVGSTGVTLQPAFALRARPVLPATGGANVIRGIGSDGREVFRVSFDGVAVADGADPAERHFAWFVPLNEAQIDDVTALEVVTPRGRVLRQARTTARGRADVRMDAAGGRTRVRWDATRYPAALVREAATGRVLAIARSGDSLLRTTAPGLEVILSDGVRSESWR
jgi:hypothetical protein